MKPKFYLVTNGDLYLYPCAEYSEKKPKKIPSVKVATRHVHKTNSDINTYILQVQKSAAAGLIETALRQVSDYYRALSHYNEVVAEEEVAKIAEQYTFSEGEVFRRIAINPELLLGKFLALAEENRERIYNEKDRVATLKLLFPSAYVALYPYHLDEYNRKDKQ